MGQNPTMYHWLESALDSKVTLSQVYRHYTAGLLDVLTTMLARDNEAKVDLAALVPRWVDEELRGRGLRLATVAAYQQQVEWVVNRTPFPPGALLPSYIRERMRDLGVCDATVLRYLAPLRMFIQFARQEGALVVDPLAGERWIPRTPRPRMIYHTYDQMLMVLHALKNTQAKGMIALLYATGIETTALFALRPGDVDLEKLTLIARGSKNEHREQRTVFVDAWMRGWGEAVRVLDHLGWGTPLESLRRQFYAAQVEAGLIRRPKKHENWNDVGVHHLHDCRRSFCVIRSLGLDGAPARDAIYCAAQLGHADETMVLRVYRKLRVQERLAMIRQREAP